MNAAALRVFEASGARQPKGVVELMQTRDDLSGIRLPLRASSALFAREKQK
jgi:hypothetical protein